MTRPLARARRHFPLHRYRSPAERREHMLAAGLVAALQAALAVSLAVCALQTYRMWRSGLAYLPGELAGAVPVGLALGAGVALAATLRSLRRIRSIRHTPLAEPRDPETPSPPG